MVEVTRREALKIFAGTVVGAGAGGAMDARTQKSDGQKGMRSWLDRTHLKGIAAGAAAGAALMWPQRRDDSAHLGYDVAAKAYNSEVTQAQADVHYDTLYAQLKAEKQQADAEGKRLVILLGESHTENGALMNNLMIADIARRLGITDSVIENNMPQSDLDCFNTGDRPLLDRGYLSLVADMDYGKLRFADKAQEALIRDYEKFPDDERLAVKHTLMALADLRVMTDGPNNPLTYAMQTRQQGYYHHHGDPLYDRYHNRLDKRLEAGMANAILSCPRDCVADYGLLHMAPLLKALEKDKHVHVAAFDTTNQRWIPHDANRSAYAKRYQELANMMGSVHKPVIDGEIARMPDVIRLTTHASLHSRAKKGEVTEERAKQLEDIMNRVFTMIEPEIAMHESGRHKSYEGAR